MKRLLIILCICIMSANTFALSLRPNAPSRYVVKEGDTLWEIAEKFLVKPWEWEKLWQMNPNIRNPNTIYPGAVLVLNKSHGHPYLGIKRRGLIKLSPMAHRDPAYRPIPPIPLHLIRPFINQNQVFLDDRLKSAPYVVGMSGDHLIASDGVHIYAKELEGKVNQNFAIYREDGRFYDTHQRAVLGYNTLFVASAIMVKPGDPSTLIVKDADFPIKVGDRILPLPAENNSLNYYPHAPRHHVEAGIVHIFDAIQNAGSHQVVVLDQGSQQGITNGDVLDAVHEGKIIIDPVYNDRKVQLPDEIVGEVMVFRTFEHVSFALVMTSLRSLHLGDLVRSP